MELELSDSELQRYARQLVVPEFGVGAQVKLKAASALVVGAGALGTQAAGYLAAAGVGRIGIVDGDLVELSNLQRQLLHFPPDIGTNKADSLADKLGVLNPEVLVEPYPVRVEESNAGALVVGKDVVIDCSDNLATRHLLNKAAVTVSVPLVEGGVSGTIGLVMTVVPGEACYRCAFGDEPEGPQVDDCEQAGIIGPVAGVIGCLQAMEAIKVIVGIGELLSGRVLQVEALAGTTSTVKVRKDPDCPVCGKVQ